MRFVYISFLVFVFQIERKCDSLKIAQNIQRIYLTNIDIPDKNSFTFYALIKFQCDQLFSWFWFFSCVNKHTFCLIFVVCQQILSKNFNLICLSSKGFLLVSLMNFAMRKNSIYVLPIENDGWKLMNIEHTKVLLMEIFSSLILW